jgi:hypothetical protein
VTALQVPLDEGAQPKQERWNREPECTGIDHN